jgi:hypothetical protein
MSKNVVDPEKLQILWCMRVTCWRSEATRAKSRARASSSTFTHAPTLARERAHTHTHRNINMLYLLLLHGNSVSVTRLSVTIRALPVSLKSHVQCRKTVHVVLCHKDRQFDSPTMEICTSDTWSVDRPTWLRFQRRRNRGWITDKGRNFHFAKGPELLWVPSERPG